MTEFRFAYPLVLLLLFVPLIVYGMPRFQRFVPRSPQLHYSDIRLMRGLDAGWRVRYMPVVDVLRWFAWILLVIGLARPQAGNAQEIIRGQGVDIVLALDISNSMDALDFEPQNRLEAAKVVIADFIRGRSFDRIGLVVFARNAYHQTPLTLDYDVLLQQLDEVRLVGDILSSDGVPLLLDGTAIGLGIASATNMLRESDSLSKVIILLTDGDNNAALDPVQAAQAAQAFGVRVYTIGMGRTGLVNVPDGEGGVIAVESDLDEFTLQNIAATAEGQHFRAEDVQDLQAIYDQIDSLERSDIERIVFVPWQDRAVMVLVPAFILLVTERLLRRSVFQTVP